MLLLADECENCHSAIFDWRTVSFCSSESFEETQKSSGEVAGESAKNC